MAEIDMTEESGQPIKDGEYGVFNNMNNAIDAAYIAQKKYMKQPMAFRSKLISAMRAFMLKKENMEVICQMAVEETGMGNYEHKLLKHELATTKTPGVEDLVSEAFAGDHGLTLIEHSPFGVIGAVSPSTNPNETVICNSIGMLAAGNTVIFAPHPSAKTTSALTIKLLNKAIMEVGGPENLIVTTASPSIESANIMFTSDKITMLCATGGPGVVKIVLKSGKKAIGAGAGNPPALVDETADIEKAAKDIIDGCCFDNNLPCIAEKEVVVVEQVADDLVANMKKNGAYELTDAAKIKELEELVIPGGRLSRDYVGRDAKTILKGIGIDADPTVRVIIMETSKDHTFAVEELMMPVLPIIRVENIAEGINVAVDLERGNRHTAIMHSTNVNNLNEMAKRVQTTIFVKNGPSYAGIGVGGEGYTTFTIAGPTGEGLTSARTFTRKRRCVLVNQLSDTEAAFHYTTFAENY
ncbi:aldehyde dehydrogenase family protein [Acetobacterium sp.]|uniref:aldehyde dehydrogenase family protein n=1 Tax=Acetobacterium sp. TaxID=1872094 RepID=UPI002F406DC7